MKHNNSSTSRTMCQHAAIALAAIVMLLSPMNSAGQDSDNVFAPVEFMVGQWTGGEGKVFTEEIWSTPSGDNMMGMFRFVQSGSGVFFEMMLVEHVGDDLVLKIKHFNSGLIGWEEKAEVHSFVLSEYDTGSALFVQADRAKRLRYVRTGDELMASVEELKEGEWKAETFRFTKQ